MLPGFPAIKKAAQLYPYAVGAVCLFFFDRAHALYRAKHHLLSPEEIRAIRDQHDLTQAALAKLLRLGTNTISRWEAGRNVQSAAMDVLLRLIRDVPATLAFLRRRAA